MKKMKLAILGCGDRGKIYASRALELEDQQVEIVAVIDVNPVALKVAGNQFNVPPNRRFSTLDAFLAANVECDSVINATMDEAHYETTKKLIEKGYNQLLEKPVVNNQEQLLELRDLANEKGVSLLICHVLRYTPFYRAVKQAILDGEVGKVQTIEMHEHVNPIHFASSFLRGKWADEDECGSSLLLQKCCHDTDLMCWLNNESVPKNVSSFASRSHYIPENAPENSTEFCADCPHNQTCVYDAKRTQVDEDWFAYQTWREVPKPISEITYEEKLQHLASCDYGRCVYKFKKNLVDRQSVTVQFANGSIGTLMLVGGAALGSRNIHIVGDKGELLGNMGENKLTIRQRVHDGKFHDLVTKEIDVSKVVGDGSGHGGGDKGLMQDYLRFLNGDKTSISITDINDSVYGHLCVYSAEKSRKNNSVESIAKLQ